MFKQVAAAGLLGLAALASAGGVDQHWDVTWVWAAPDGFGRPVIGINGQWPPPVLRATKGDRIKITLTNKLGNQTTGIHWHGMPQTSTNWMDGPSMVTQCPIPPNMTFTYDFDAEVAGTYWYHSHNMGQYPDGFRGALIVDDPADPFAGQYDEEHTVTLSDWYHTQSITLVQDMLQPSNPDGLPPRPDGALINDGQGSDYDFDPSKTYRFRFICMSALSSFMIKLKDHSLTVIMADGSYINSQVVDQLRITPGQRYDVLVKPLATDTGNVPFLISADNNPDYTADPSTLNWGINLTATLVQDPQGDRPTFTVDRWTPADEMSWSTFDDEALLPEPDQNIQIDFGLCPDANGIPRMCMNKQTYITQKVPTLYSASSLGAANENATVYGDVNPFVTQHNQVIQIVLNNLNPGVHPFHLHGHLFQVVARGASGSGAYPGGLELESHPVRRDTVSVFSNSYVVLRFVANNPGVYLFHCHIEWHVEMGLTASIIESPDLLRNLPIPEDHIKACKAQNIATTGNAGGNSDDPFDTSNFNTSPPTTYTGSTFFPPSNSCPAKRRRRHVKKNL